MSQKRVLPGDYVLPLNFPTRTASEKLQSLPSKPTEFGSFSLHSSLSNGQAWVYHDDRSGLGELHRRGRAGQSIIEEIHMPLGKGFQTTREPRMISGASGFEFLLRWIVDHPEEFAKHKYGTYLRHTLGEIKSDVTIVCWRNVLQTVMLTPYEKLSGWVIPACKIGGLICLSIQSNGTDRDETRNARLERDSFWECKFAQYMTNLPKHQESLPDKPINNRFCSIVKTKIRNHTITSGGEAVCYDPLKLHMRPPGCYVKLMIHQRPDREDLWRKFWAQDMRSVWAECYVSGVPTVIVGYHDENGNVSMTEELQTDQIPALIKSSGKQAENWSEKACISFLDAFVDLVKESVTEECSEALYTFEWNPRTSQAVNVVLHSPSSPLHFIPDWYLDQTTKSKTDQ